MSHRYIGGATPQPVKLSWRVYALVERKYVVTTKRAIPWKLYLYVCMLMFILECVLLATALALRRLNTRQTHHK